jgi:antitoxin (DNA-binding transcriptional repressor) of toxin-antitoxin stability system
MTGHAAPIGRGRAGRRRSSPLVTTSDCLWEMKTAGVKQLKARLSEYLREVRAGETILVTDRDQVIAELRPVPPRPVGRETVDEILNELAGRGEVTRAALPKGKWSWRVEGLGLPVEEVQRILDELREDRGS